MDKKEVLRDMLKDMNVPSSRLALNREDLKWLLNNLGIRNHRHKKFGDAIGRIKQLYKEASND